MTATTLDIEIFEEITEDHSLNCETDRDYHAKYGTGPATWMIWLSPPDTDKCHCGNAPEIFALCDGCLEAAKQLNASCRHCDAPTGKSIYDHITRMERL